METAPRVRIVPRVRIALRERRAILNKYIVHYALQDGFYVKLDALLAEFIGDDNGARVPIQYLHEQALDKPGFHRLKEAL